MSPSGSSDRCGLLALLARLRPLALLAGVRCLPHLPSGLLRLFAGLVEPFAPRAVAHRLRQPVERGAQRVRARGELPLDLGGARAVGGGDLVVPLALLARELLRFLC